VYQLDTNQQLPRAVFPHRLPYGVDFSGSNISNSTSTIARRRGMGLRWRRKTSQLVPLVTSSIFLTITGARMGVHVMDVIGLLCTSSRPGSIIGSKCYGGLGQVLKYKVIAKSFLNLLACACAGGWWVWWRSHCYFIHRYQQFILNSKNQQITSPGAAISISF
jgi:hypothetical protein